VTLSPQRTAEMTQRLDALVSAAQAARQAPDLDAIKQALNAVWFAVHKAHDYATEAERETRQEALQAIGEVA